MKLKKFISSSLIAGLLFNSAPVSFASILSEDGRYETFEGNNITVNNILEEDEVNIEVEGNTLVNLIRTSDFYNYSEINDSILLSGNSSINNGICDIKIDKIPLIKPNSKYTFVYNVLEATTSNIVQLYNSSSTILKNSVNLPKRTGINKVIFETKDNINSDTQVHGFYIHLVGDNSDINNSNKFVFTNTMILEGDWTNRDVPEYFEGIQSSFENNLVTQEMIDNGEEKLDNLGKYKVEYKISGKNKVNISDLVLINNNRYYITDKYNTKGVIPLKKYTNYIMTSYVRDLTSHDARIFLYDDKGNFITHKEFYETFNSGEATHLGFYVGQFTDDKGNTWIDLSQRDDFIIQLEEGSVGTEYTPYKESINAFYLNSPLLKGDTIEYINRQATHVHNYREVEFDGSNDEGWFLNPDWSSYNSLISIKRSKLNIPRSGDIICSTFKPKTFFDESKDMTYCVYAGTNNFNIILEKNTTLEEWLLYLKDNPLKVVYELENPVYEPIKANLAIPIYKEITYVSNNSNAPVSMKLTIDRTINRTIEAIELAKTNPTASNISKARYWTNLLKESIKKDEFQDEINSITGIEDLQLEKKTVTANMDVYIKSENMLSLSLSSNSITFEDFNGTEDLEQDRALELTINSSLPYEINAYLEEEIQNANKTAIMDKQILNLKESGTNDYKVFVDIKTKLTLISNSDAGNNKIHNFDFKLNGGIAHKADVYKTTIKFEAVQK